MFFSYSRVDVCKDVHWMGIAITQSVVKYSCTGVQLYGVQDTVLVYRTDVRENS
jgi:hypothetical protein